MENLQLLSMLLAFISVFFVGIAFGLSFATLLYIRRETKSSTDEAVVDNLSALPPITLPSFEKIYYQGKEIVAPPETPKEKKKPTQSVVMKYRKPQELRAEKEAAIEESFLEDLKKEERESGTFAL